MSHASLAERVEVPRRYNAYHDFVTANLSAGRGGKIAFDDGSRRLSYGELDAACARFAGAIGGLGVMPEQRVALMMLDTVDFPVAFWGCVRAGIIPVPLNTLLTSSQYDYILGDSRARVCIVDQLLLERLAPIRAGLPYLEHVLLSGAGGVPRAGTDGTFEALLANARPRDEVADTCADDIAFWLYSSGSTGMPKGTRHVHSSLIQTAVLYGQKTLGIREDDVAYSVAKLFFAYGLGNGMSFPMSVGASTVLLPGRPTPEAVFGLMRQHEPTLFFGVPTLYAALLAQPSLERGCGSPRLRLCVSAGEALPAEVGERWRERVGCDILDGIGSTEMLHIFVSNRPGAVHYGTSGVPVPGYLARLVDDDGSAVGVDEIGELVVNGPSAADGYWNQREKSRRTFRGEWTHTGDKYRQDGAGLYHYCGRTDDMFKVSGNWVSPFDVESALVSHEAVLEAAVVGHDDVDGLTKPKAFIVLKSGYEADEALFSALKEHVKRAAGPWKYPRWIEAREELPKTATGKIQRFKLREDG